MYEPNPLLVLTPVLAAALARPPRRRPARKNIDFPANNYVADLSAETQRAKAEGSRTPADLSAEARRAQAEGGGGYVFSRNNYVAEPCAEAPSGTPAGGRGYDFSGNNYYVAERKKAGATPGNRNAFKHGCYSAKQIAQNRALRAYLKRIDTFCAEIGRMCRTKAARPELDRFIVANMPASPRDLFLDGRADDDPRTPLSF